MTEAMEEEQEMWNAKHEQPVWVSHLRQLPEN